MLAWPNSHEYLYRGEVLGCTSMDRAGFDHAPKTADTPVEVRDIGGLSFIHVATPGEMEPSTEEGGPMRIMVHKSHVLGFEAGREGAIMETAEGSFIELVGSSDKDDELVLPAGASLRYLKLDAPLVIVLPEPTTAYFWFDTGNGSRSFQGPCDLPKQ